MSKPSKSAIIGKCRHDEDGCLIWTGKVSHNGHPTGYVWEDGRSRSFTVRRYLWELYTGEPVPDGMVVSTRCGKAACLHKNCLHVITLGERSKRMHEQMTQATKLTRSRKLSEAQRAARGKVSPEQVAAIINSDKGPYTTARELGVSGVVASRIKRGLAYKEYTAHPFAGLLSANDARRRA